jgi:hypothetical protein
MIFALFFLILGSSKLLGSFAAATKDGNHVFRFRLATRDVLFSIGAAAISASLGGRMLDNFIIPVLVLQTPILYGRPAGGHAPFQRGSRAPSAPNHPAWNSPSLHLAFFCSSALSSGEPGRAWYSDHDRRHLRLDRTGRLHEPVKLIRFRAFGGRIPPLAPVCGGWPRELPGV